MSFWDRVRKFLNWTRSSKPDVNLNFEFYEQLKPFRLPLILLVSLMLIGTLGYMAFSGFL